VLHLNKLPLCSRIRLKSLPGTNKDNYRSVIEFTTFQFLHNLQLAKKARVFVPGNPFRPSVMKHSSLSNQS
jgi:hypothetical protein